MHLNFFVTNRIKARSINFLKFIIAVSLLDSGQQLHDTNALARARFPWSHPQQGIHLWTTAVHEELHKEDDCGLTEGRTIVLFFQKETIRNWHFYLK